MKKTNKRLEIKSTTVRALVDDDLRGVVGGDRFTYVIGGCGPFDTGVSCNGTCGADCQSVFGSRCVSC